MPKENKKTRSKLNFPACCGRCRRCFPAGPGLVSTPGLRFFGKYYNTIFRIFKEQNEKKYNFLFRLQNTRGLAEDLLRGILHFSAGIHAFFLDVAVGLSLRKVIPLH